MSLLDDVSIVITPNAYNVGTLYAVIPVPTEGTEILSQPVDLVTDFIVNGGGVIVNANTFDTFGGVYDGIRKNSCFTVGKRYKLTIQGDTTSSGFTIGDTSASGNEYGSGFGTFYFTAVGNGSLWIRQQTSGTTNITSISVKEYTSADMDVTRATAATRVDENGLVNYAEIIGGELVDNGSFTTDSDWNKGTGWTISGGNASFNTTTNNSLTQSGFANSKIYKVSIDVVSYVRGNPFIAIGQGSQYTIPTSIGTHIIYVTSGSVDAILRIYSGAFGSGGEGSIDNVSVKEAARDNVPRIDYTGGGCPHILAEPQRTNLITYSEDFTQYTNSDTTDTANTVTSPDGTVNGTTLTASGSGSLNHIITSPTYTIASGEITSSIFAKKGTVNYIRLRLNGTTGGERAWYNLNNGTIDGEDVSGSAKIEDYGNGWYRCSLTSSSNIASGSGKSLQIFIQDSGGSQTAWTANGTENIYIWGTQTEQGYGTSYIPNFGTALGVTRNQDIFTRDGIGSLINSTEGVLFVEIAAFADYTTYRYMGLTDGGSDNRVIILYYNSSTRIRVLLSSGGTKYFDAYYAVTSIEDFHKVALKWKENDFALWIDGVERATDTSGLAPIGLNTVALDQAGGDNFYGKVKQLQVYDTALTDEQLEALTT